MACNCKETTPPCLPCSQAPCVDTHCECPVLLNSKCINNISIDTPCFNIPKGLPFNEWLPIFSQAICDKFATIYGYFTLKNVGVGLGKVFAGIALTGERKIKSILAGNLITVVDLTDEIRIDVNQTALTTFVNGLIPPSVNDTALNVGTGLGLSFRNKVSNVFNFRKIKTENTGTGESILKTESTDLINDNVVISAKKLSSKGTLEITSDTDSIYIDVPTSTQIPGLYVNNLYKPTYQDSLNPLNLGKGEGTLAKPFTDTRTYTLPTVFTDAPNTAIQNALDNYAGGTSNTNRLNPLKQGQKIIVQDNNGTGYIFPNTYNYNFLDIEFFANVNNIFAGLIVDMDNPLYFQSLNSNVIITTHKTFQAEGDKFKNSGNTQAGTTYTTGKAISLVTIGDGEIYSGYTSNTAYLIQSVANNENANNNDGSLTFNIKARINCKNQGIYKIGGLSRIDFTDYQIISGDLVGSTDINLKSFVHNGGQVRTFGKGSFDCGQSAVRVDMFQFNPTVAYPTYLYLLGSMLSGNSGNLFTKTNSLLNVFIQADSLNAVYAFSTENIFESPNVWNTVNFDNNRLSNGGLSALKVDLTGSNYRSVTNTIGTVKIETLVTRPDRATAGLPKGSIFINTNNNNASTSTWFRDIII